MTTLYYIMIPVFLLAMGLGAQSDMNGNAQQDQRKAFKLELPHTYHPEKATFDKNRIYTSVDKAKN